MEKEEDKVEVIENFEQANVFDFRPVKLTYMPLKSISEPIEGVTYE